MGNNSGSYYAKERYTNEPIGYPAYGSVQGREQVDVGGSGAQLPPINPLAYVTNIQRYGMTTQIVYNQSKDPRGDIDHKIPLKTKSELQAPRNLGALLDRRSIVSQVREVEPVADSVKAYAGMQNPDHHSLDGEAIDDAELKAIYGDEDPGVFELM
jgi:hypothetical protein